MLEEFLEPKTFKSMKYNLKFPTDKPDFFSTLSKRVNAYFKSQGISRNANGEMIVKTVFMFVLYFTPYVLLITNSTSNSWMMLGLCVMMGLGVAGIGLSVMHDA